MTKKRPKRNTFKVDKKNPPGKPKVTKFYDGKEIPEPEKHRCKKCGGPIRFTKTMDGGWMPISTTGGDHFHECNKWQISGEYF